MYIENFKQLTVWQRSIELVKEVYSTCRQLPSSETYGLIGQMQRAAISIPANIAEGKKRKTKKDFLYFLRIASGSAAELETFLVIAGQVYTKSNYTRASALLLEVQKMLTVMISRLESSSSS